MFDKEGPLFEYNSRAMEKVTFYFRHLSGEEQEIYRKSYFQFDSTYDLMAEIVSNQVVIYSIDPLEEYYTWPEEEIEKEEFLQVIPRDVVIEVGAAILGWVRTNEENGEQFVDRIVEDLRETLTPAER
jgi:hypothetical protein